MRSKKFVFRTSWAGGLLQVGRPLRRSGVPDCSQGCCFRPHSYSHKYHVNLWFLSNWKPAFLTTLSRELLDLNQRGNSETGKHSHEKSPSIPNCSRDSPNPPCNGSVSSETEEVHVFICILFCTGWSENIIFGLFYVFIIQVQVALLH